MTDTVTNRRRVMSHLESCGSCREEAVVGVPVKRGHRGTDGLLDVLGQPPGKDQD